MEFEVIDAHVHCGKKGYNFKDYLKQIKGSKITSVVVFPQASDIYPKGRRIFKDTEEWKQDREEANKYSLSLIKSVPDFKVYPFKFVWNDFNTNNFDTYLGIKWHRRYVDPKYKIGSPKFVKLIKRLREKNMPIIFEDELKNTMKFLNHWAKGINVIIPHMGFISRSYDELRKKGVWRWENVYTDTSYASDVSMDDIKKHIDTYGSEKILFGSDYPFSANKPQEELEKILCLDIKDEEKENVLCKNALRLLKKVKH